MGGTCRAGRVCEKDSVAIATWLAVDEHGAPVARTDIAGGTDISADTGHASLMPGAGVVAAATVVVIGPGVDALAPAGNFAGRTGEDTPPLLASVTGATGPAALAAMLPVLLEVDTLVATELPANRARSDPDLGLTNLRPADPGATLEVPVARPAGNQADAGPRRLHQLAPGEGSQQRAEHTSA